MDSVPRHCLAKIKDAETTGQIDVASKHQEVRTRIVLPIDHETRHIKTFNAKKKAKQQSRSGDNWNEHTIRVTKTTHTETQHNTKRRQTDKTKTQARRSRKRHARSKR